MAWEFLIMRRHAGKTIRRTVGYPLKKKQTKILPGSNRIASCRPSQISDP
jgi:hypothetical protein